MAIRVPEFLIPSSPFVPFVVSDKYIQGGYRVVADTAARDAIHVLARKEGMLVYTQSNGIAWQLLGDGNWKEASLGGADISPVAPVYFDVNGALGVDPEYLIPPGGATGEVLTLDVNGNAVWSASQASDSVGARMSESYIATEEIAAGSFHTFSVDMGKTLVLLNVGVDSAQLKLEAFGTAFRDEVNPYTFVSRPDQLFDNGTSITAGGELTYGKRYSIISNFEETPSTSIYWKITNQTNFPITPTIDLTYLIIE